mmetsp:Transcript_105718/g.170132  ORF Transcript_105718/g.170132 Transcript_105718/m.170132 type:complete len:335 (+) Transcript_105718:14-1018(+)
MQYGTMLLRHAACACQAAAQPSMAARARSVPLAFSVLAKICNIKGTRNAGACVPTCIPHATARLATGCAVFLPRSFLGVTGSAGACRSLTTPASTRSSLSIRHFSGAEKASGDLTLKQRFSMLAKDYGKVVLLSHSTIWAGSLVATWLAIKSMDMTKFLGMLPDTIASHIDPSAGAFAIAFVVVKLTGPMRLMVDLAITPMLARYLRHTWLAGPLGLQQVRQRKIKFSRDVAQSAHLRILSVRDNVRKSQLATSVVGTKTRITAAVRKSIPRLEWLRIRERIDTPISSAPASSWSARTWQAVRNKVQSSRNAARTRAGARDHNTRSPRSFSVVR